MSPGAPLLRLRVSAGYRGRPGVLEDVRLEVGAGEVVALVGASGCGKSSLALAILRLIQLRGGWARGEVVFEGRDLMSLPERQMRAIRGARISLVLQSPLSSLNPALRVATQFREAWVAHRWADRAAWRDQSLEALHLACLPEPERILERYPDQLSVGQAQRVLIGMAILHRPALLIADEPTSALDVITQAEILRLFAGLNRRLGIAILYISHDLLSVASLCHRVAILAEGTVIETGLTQEVFDNPRHDYTRRLIGAIPRLSFTSSLIRLAGTTETLEDTAGRLRRLQEDAS